jgi:hypothetical protein
VGTPCGHLVVSPVQIGRGRSERQWQTGICSGKECLEARVHELSEEQSPMKDRAKSWKANESNRDRTQEQR